MQRPRIRTILVAEGEMIEQVFRRGDALFRKRLRDARPDAFDELDGRIDREHALMLEHFRQYCVSRRFTRYGFSLKKIQESDR
jgi:hypothetical protein